MKKNNLIPVLAITIASFTACSESNSIESTVTPPKEEIVSDSDTDNEINDSIVIDMLPATRTITLTKDQLELAQQNNDFSFNLYRSLWQTEKKSNITSPMSITYLMGMLHDGASGKTAQEIAQMLRTDIKGTELNAFCKALISQAPQADASVTLQTANIVAANKGIALSDAFKQNMHDYYDAEVTSLDFSQSQSVEYLNEWCHEKTQGVIPAIIDQLSPSDLIVLMNAISFKATWAEKFDTKNTSIESFAKADGSVVTLPMMYRKAEILYSKNEDYSSIRLPFGSGDIWSMYVLLPTEGKDIDNVVASLTNESWEQNKATNKTIVDIKLPRFTTTSDILLNDVIASLGAHSMFDPAKADFTNLCNTDKIAVNLIKQKAAIEVTEEGTKTSAVTVAKSLSVNGSTEKAVFHANRPFLYIIQEMNTKAIFFIGVFAGE